ncbi:unnamed protein product [Rhizoctonia solani]|uniref:G domain-containing protein n=1 Tax=Rhizoctonia solani TaxID=456999 RepID=A0A8H3DXA5_9AGAM|nr:unnamed protein product [Rhizoctonia solani]
MVHIGSSDSDSSTTPTGSTMKRPLSPDLPPPPPPPPPPEKPIHTATSREAERLPPKATQPHQTRDDTIRVLILGKSGSGKTHLLRTLCQDPKRPLAGLVCEPTREPCSNKVNMGEARLELIDTPGFDNMSMSDTEVFTKIADYLLQPDRVKIGITGIVYVHRAGEVVQSKSLSRIFQVLADIFLQDIGISRLTVLEVQVGVQRVAYPTFLDELQNRSSASAFTRLWQSGAKVSRSPDRNGFIKILRGYIPETPIVLPIQLNASHGSLADLTPRIEQALGYLEQESVQTLLRNREHTLQETYESELTHQRESQSLLKQQLKEAELGYSSLRSQLQLQENVEQSEVVQALNDLNRMIDDIGRSISAYLADTYVAHTFSRDPADVTALDSVNLSALKTLLGHVDGKPSMIMSSDGKGMHIENFFDFAIRHMICRYLTRAIFRPFHPAISSDLNQVLTETYENIRKEAPQVIAGKWRSDTFKNIYKDDEDKQRQHINDHFENLMGSRLMPLATYVFGRKIRFTEEYSDRLYLLMEMAWILNSKLKASVIMLGDFVYTSYFPRSQFYPTLVEEFEPNPRHPKPLTVLGTLALGLLAQRAVGGGDQVEEKVVSKATVLTNNAFV